MSAANQPEPSLRDKVRKCFTDTEMEHDDDLMLFDIEQTITNLVAFFQAHEEAAVRAKLQELEDIVNYYDSSGADVYTLSNRVRSFTGDYTDPFEKHGITHPQAGEGETNDK